MPYVNAKLYKRGPGRPKKGYSKTGKKLGRPSTKASVSQVKRIVKRTIAAHAENKTVQFFSTGANVLNSSNSGFVSSILPLSPYQGSLTIPQGVGQGERIGNRVRIKNLTFKGTLYPKPHNATTNPNPVPVQVVFWIFYKRSEPNVLPSNVTGWFQAGNGVRNFENQLSDIMSKVNTDEYRLLKKRVFKVGNSGYSGTGTQPTFQQMWNNDFKLNVNFKINLTKYAIKNVRYNDSSNIPRSRGIFLLAQALDASGNSMANNTITTTMSYELSCTYEDM